MNAFSRVEAFERAREASAPVIDVSSGEDEGSDSSEDDDCFIVNCVPPTKKAKRPVASTANEAHASDHVSCLEKLIGDYKSLTDENKAMKDVAVTR